jgi:hypothetical protein
MVFGIIVYYTATHAMRFMRLDRELQGFCRWLLTGLYAGATKWLPLEVHSGHILAPGNEHAQNEPPETHFGRIWCRAAKMLKIRLLGLILAISRTR